MEKNKKCIIKNRCPYCSYDTSAATSIKGNSKPNKGNISFCMMCCQPSIFDENMILIKFDLNSITNLVDRNHIKSIQFRMNEFWEQDKVTNKNLAKNREKYLKNMENNNE